MSGYCLCTAFKIHTYIHNLFELLVRLFRSNLQEMCLHNLYVYLFIYLYKSCYTTTIIKCKKAYLFKNSIRRFFFKLYLKL